MQKWLPDAFDSVDAALAVGHVSANSFEAEGSGANYDGDMLASRFKSESGFSDAKTLLGHLTQKERTQLFDLVEQDVASEYEKRETELRAELDASNQAMEKSLQDTLKNFSQELESALGDQLKEISSASARLSVQLAEKIIRSTVDLDPEVLARTLETTRFKIHDDNFLILTMNPEDADWFETKPELLTELNIKQVNQDRRIQRGGCKIKSGNQEWDATIKRQLESFSEVIEEAIATAGKPELKINTEDPDEPEMG